MEPKTEETVSPAPLVQPEVTVKPRPLSTRRLFVARMIRSGREQEWYATVKKLQAETGKQFGAISMQAMQAMGYEGPDREREIDAAWQAEERAKLKTPLQVQLAEIRAERVIETFEQALASLPDHAAVQDEMDWVRAHPAMFRKSRNTDKTKDILITLNDILHAGCGPAPSRSAVVTLQHWCNCPHEFFKGMLSEHKKITEEEAKKNNAQRDVGIGDIERLINEVKLSLPAKQVEARS